MTAERRSPFLTTSSPSGGSSADSGFISLVILLIIYKENKR